ncbi:MAG: DUF1844 domain-containing protein, partial [bacterium]|nr:DUF1844 domain-containing protein [bacterium]
MADATTDQKNEFLFMQMVMMFQGMAMQNLGKVMNPVTNKAERNLDQAKNMIDLLGMLEAKTKGNLGNNERNMLTHALYELRMNYVDEVKKTPASSEQTEDEAEP